MQNPVALRGAVSQIPRAAERWLSGLRHTPGKRAWLIPTEGSNPSLSATPPNFLQISNLEKTHPTKVYDKSKQLAQYSTTAHGHSG